MQSTQEVVLKDLTTLDLLIEQLEQVSAEEAVHLVKRLDIPVEEFLPYSTWLSERYTRNCISRNDHYELILLCWEPGQETPIHCHGGQECWVYGVQGTLEEVRFKETGPKGELQKVFDGEMNSSGLSYMTDDMGYHLLKNITSSRAMSLHLYMKPIEQCRVFDLETGDSHWKDLKYDTLAGKPMA